MQSFCDIQYPSLQCCFPECSIMHFTWGSIMQRGLKPDSKKKIIREACAVADYRYPEDTHFRENLTALLDDPSSSTWIKTSQLLKHMNNYHRIKLLKRYPELYPDIDLFTLTLSAFIPERDVAKFALVYLPNVRTREEYRKILAAIPDEDVKSFKRHVEIYLEKTCDPEQPDLSFYKEMNNEATSKPPRDSRKLNPVTPDTALLTVSAAIYYYTQSYRYTLPILWGVYSIYKFCGHRLQAEKTRSVEIIHPSALFFSPLKITDENTKSKDYSQQKRLFSP